ncbi:hypothetical protein [Lysobacter enzymogenes]|uniref:hypothetical protein n=1 Tax=Lysobacter enzymogenes TaxID=69 RepID=UPI001A970ED6|nr:hypothetical protein [Lysobacter enzymogenes]QQP94839.1 hypothetical protein JHW38_16500 [Lysobacter enzymogenes]
MTTRIIQRRQGEKTVVDADGTAEIARGAACMLRDSSLSTGRIARRSESMRQWRRSSADRAIHAGRVAAIARETARTAYFELVHSRHAGSIEADATTVQIIGG